MSPEFFAMSYILPLEGDSNSRIQEATFPITGRGTADKLKRNTDFSFPKSCSKRCLNHFVVRSTSHLTTALTELASSVLISSLSLLKYRSRSLDSSRLADRKSEKFLYLEIRAGNIIPSSKTIGFSLINS